MSGRSRVSSAGPRSWHALIEHYTPDGTLGRLLLGAFSGSTSVVLLLFALWGFVTFSLGSLLVALASTGAGLATGALAVVTLWSVYLSLIGNVEPAAAYAETGSTGPEPIPEPDADEGDPMTVLKRQYAAERLSDGEFERRVDRLLDADERVRRSDEDDGTAATEPVTERER